MRDNALCESKAVAQALQRRDGVPDGRQSRMANQILYDVEARRKILEGIRKLARAAGLTLGPTGRNVMLSSSYGGPSVDGVPQPDGFSPWLNFYRRGLLRDLERRGYLRRMVLRTAEGAIVRPRAVRETLGGTTVALEVTPVLYELR